MSKLGKFFINILIGIDQFGNVVTGGDPDETISSRLGKIKMKYHGRIPWRRPLAKILDWGLDKIDRDHCIESINHDEGVDAIADRLDHEGHELPPPKWATKCVRGSIRADRENGGSGPHLRGDTPIFPRFLSKCNGIQKGEVGRNEQ